MWMKTVTRYSALCSIIKYEQYIYLSLCVCMRGGGGRNKITRPSLYQIDPVRSQANPNQLGPVVNWAEPVRPSLETGCPSRSVSVCMSTCVCHGVCVCACVCTCVFDSQVLHSCFVCPSTCLLHAPMITLPLINCTMHQMGRVKFTYVKMACMY